MEAFDEHLGTYNLDKSQLYLPLAFGLEEQDRIVLSTNEVFRVETILTRRYPDVIVADLGEDTRE